jgi:hypothetical protein
MLIILQDAQGAPSVFHLFGAIPKAEAREWLRQNALALPNHVIELWEVTGGGDIFRERDGFSSDCSFNPKHVFRSG